MAAFREMAAVALLALGLAGCVGLPASGPLASRVTAEAGERPAGGVGYSLVDITESINAALTDEEVRDRDAAFADVRPATPRIGVGDALSVTIWEIGGGLFGAQATLGQTSQASRGATIADAVVEQDGAITIPFAGRVEVLGLTPSEAEGRIVRALSEKTVEPQSLVSVVKNVSNSVTVGGEVGAAARLPLSVKGDRILDALAQSGGVRIPVSEAVVRLTRGDTSLSIRYDDILDNPAENYYLLPGDTLTVLREPRSFTAFGAVVSNAQVPFPTKTIMLDEAIARVGGLNDQRADPRGVFIFRYERAETLRKLGATFASAADASEAPVVYRLDFKDPGSYFLARRFLVKDKDMIYVANARMTEIQKFLTAIGSFLMPAVTSAAAISVVNP